MKKLITSLFCIFSLIVISFSQADEICQLRGIERMKSGAYWPIGLSDYDSNKGGWLFGGINYPSYFSGQYHLAIDMMTSLEDYAYPVADGEIIAISNKEISGWGPGNACAVIKHQTSDGKEFLAFYGHIRLLAGYKEGSQVQGGVPFATYGPYSGGVHLHFAIRDNVDDPITKFGTAPIGDWPEQFGFVDPIEFLQNNDFNGLVEVDCGDLESQYPENFQKLGIFSCSEAFFNPNNGEYIIYHQVITEEGFWADRVVSFTAGKVLGYSTEIGTGLITINPFTNSTDIHITHVEISPYKEGSWHNEVDIDLGPGESFDLEMEVRTRNKSNHDLKDVDVDYLVTKDKKDFDPDKRCRLEDEKVDIKEGEKESKHSGRIRVFVGEDLKIVTVSGKHSFTFPITEQNIKEREITLYFYTDVETKDGSDRDVSSESSTDERGKLEIRLFSNTAKFSADPLTGIAPLTVNFTDQSLGGNITDWDWAFGDGNITNVVNPTNTYINPGTYSASLVITNQNGEVRIAEKTITVVAAIPSITIINPTSSDKWRSDKDHAIRWNSKNLPHQEPIKIEYTCDGGKHWRTIHDGYTGNDGSKKWKMDKSKTKNTSSGYIRIIRRSDNFVLGISPKFKIDHKKKTPEW